MSKQQAKKKEQKTEDLDKPAIDPKDPLYLQRVASLVQDISRLKAPSQNTDGWTERSLREYIVAAGSHLRKVVKILEAKRSDPASASIASLMPKREQISKFVQFIRTDKRFGSLMLYSGLAKAACFTSLDAFSKGAMLEHLLAVLKQQPPAEFELAHWTEIGSIFADCVLQRLQEPRPRKLAKKDNVFLRAFLKLDSPSAYLRAALLAMRQCTIAPSEEDRVMTRAVVELRKARERLLVIASQPRRVASGSFAVHDVKSLAELNATIVPSPGWLSTEPPLCLEELALLRLLRMLHDFLQASNAPETQQDEKNYARIRKLLATKVVGTLLDLLGTADHCFRRAGDTAADDSAAVSQSSGSNSSSPKVTHNMLLLASEFAMDIVSLLEQLATVTATVTMIDSAPNRHVIPDLLLLHPSLHETLGADLMPDEAAKVPVNDPLAGSVLILLFMLLKPESNADHLQSYPRLTLLCRALVALVRMGRKALPGAGVNRSTYAVEQWYTASEVRNADTDAHRLIQVLLTVVHILLLRPRSRELLLRAGLVAAVEPLRRDASKVIRDLRDCVLDELQQSGDLVGFLNLELDLHTVLEAASWEHAATQLQRLAENPDFSVHSKEALELIRIATPLLIFGATRRDKEICRTVDDVAASDLPDERNWAKALLASAKSFQQAMDESRVPQLSAEEVLSRCANCNKVQLHKGEFKVCARCRSVKYCCGECQKQHWKREHKAVCKPAAIAD